MKICTNKYCHAEIDDYMDRCPYCGVKQVSESIDDKVASLHPQINENDDLKRHVFIPIWLCIVIAVNALAAFISFSPKEMWGSSYPDELVIWSRLIAIMDIINIIGASLLLVWKKTGFYVITVCVIVGTLIDVNQLHSFPFEILGLIILYYVLQLKSNGLTYWRAMDLESQGNE